MNDGSAVDDFGCGCGCCCCDCDDDCDCYVASAVATCGLDIAVVVHVFGWRMFADGDDVDWRLTGGHARSDGRAQWCPPARTPFWSEALQYCAVANLQIDKIIKVKKWIIKNGVPSKNDQFQNKNQIMKKIKRIPPTTK